MSIYYILHPQLHPLLLLVMCIHNGVMYQALLLLAPPPLPFHGFLYSPSSLRTLPLVNSFIITSSVPSCQTCLVYRLGEVVPVLVRMHRSDTVKNSRSSYIYSDSLMFFFCFQSLLIESAGYQ